MKKYSAFYFIIILLLISLISCIKGGDDTVSPLPEIKTVISLWAGTDTAVSISSLKVEGNTFTVTSANRDIAQITIDNKNLLVSSYKVGKVDVILKNEQGKIYRFLVQPIAMRGVSSGSWISISKDDQKSYVTVRATDQKFADSIYNVLLKEINDNGESGFFRYQFYDNLTFSFFSKTKGNYPYKEGSWSYDKLRLTLNANNKNQLYQIIPISPYPLTFIELKRDLTDQLSQQFPDKGITNISTHQFFVYFMNP